jgi:hypothetical protein
MTMTCDLFLGKVSITTSNIECNGTTLSDDPARSFLIIATQKVKAPVYVASLGVTLAFTEVTSEASVTIEAADVMVFYKDSNQVAQIACTGGANVTLGAITDGSVSVRASAGPGIGTPGDGACSSLCFLNGSFGVEGASGSAAIGTGEAWTSTSTLENVAIVDGTINASSGNLGCGIGIGYTSGTGGSAASTLGNVTIMDGTITVSYTGSSGSGIGIGATWSYTGSSMATLGNVMIMNGTITVSYTGSGGSGIGIGGTAGMGGGSAASMLGNVTIMNGTVTINVSGDGGSGIGVGSIDQATATATLENVMISGGKVSVLGPSVAIGPRGRASRLYLAGPAIVKGNSVRVSDITLSGGSLLFIAESAPFFDGTLVKSGTTHLDVAILYTTETAVDLTDVSSLENLSDVLHIQNVTMPDGGGWSLCLLSSGVGRCFFDEFIDVHSLVVSVPTPEFYSISGERGGRVGQLVVPGGSPGFQVEPGGLVVQVAEFVEPTPLATSSLLFVQSWNLPPSLIAYKSLLFEKSADLSLSPVGQSSLMLGSSEPPQTEGFLQSGPVSTAPLKATADLRASAPPEFSDAQSREAMESTPTKSDPDRGSSALIAGMVVGIVIAVGVAAAVAWWCCRALGCRSGGPREDPPQNKLEEEPMSIANPLESVNLFDEDCANSIEPIELLDDAA